MRFNKSIRAAVVNAAGIPEKIKLTLYTQYIVLYNG